MWRNERTNCLFYLKVAEGVDSAFEMIPEADEVHSNIDTAVNAWVHHLGHAYDIDCGDDDDNYKSGGQIGI